MFALRRASELTFKSPAIVVVPSNSTSNAFEYDSGVPI